MGTKRVKTQDNLNSGSTHNIKNQPSSIDLQVTKHPLARDSETLLAYLPEEVWELISLKQLNKKENQNLINSSSFFRDLLLSKRVLLLYTPVLELVFRTVLSETDPKDDSYERAIEAYKIQKSFLLSNREVCHVWKHGIDKLESNWTPKRRELNSNGLVHKQFSHNYTFHQSSDIQNFINKFQRTYHFRNNPFIGSYVCIFLDLNRRGQFVDYCNSMTLLLNNYGRHIQNCKIYVQPSGPCPAQVHSIIVYWLCALPNLETLKVSYNIQNVRSTQDFDQQLPKWKQLKNMILKDLPRSLVDLLLANNGQVTSLMLHRSQSDEIDPLYLTELIQLKNLDLLEITMCTSSDYGFLKRVYSPLKTLCVYHNFKWDETLDWSNMLLIISSQFCKTLEDVTLHFPDQYEILNCEKAMEYSLTERLNLPQVKKLKVYMGNIFSLDFILGVRQKLEELIIVAPFPDWIYSTDDINKAKMNQIIQFVGYEDKILESNIWSIFQKLKTVTVLRRDQNNVVFSRKNLLKNNS